MSTTEHDVFLASVPKIQWSKREGHTSSGEIGRAGNLDATLFTTYWDASSPSSQEKRWALTCSLPGWITIRDKHRWATQEEAQEVAQQILFAFVARLLGQHDDSKE